MKPSLKSEFLLPLYLWGFVFLKLFYSYINSTQLLAAFATVVFASFLLKNSFQMIKSGKTHFILFFLIFFFFDSFLRINNDIGIRYFFEFIYSGFIPFLMVLTITNFDQLLKNFSIFGTVSLLIFGFDGILGYPIFGDYMSFGFTVVLPSLFSIVYLKSYYRSPFLKIILNVLLLFALYNALIYSNRGVLLSFGAFVVFYLFKKKIIPTKNLIFLIPIFLLFLLYAQEATIFFIEIADSQGVSSYSLTQYKNILIGGASDEDFFSGRFNIWYDALLMINNNPLLGSGIGSFESKYAVYSHNFILDIFIFHGYIIGLIILMFTIKSSFNLYKANYILFGFIFFLIFPKLLLSSYYLRESYFWLLLSFYNVKQNK